MIISWILGALWGFIGFILRFLPEIPLGNSVSGIVTYIYYVFDKGAALFFLLIPYTAFKVALDVIFFFYFYEPISYFVMWIIRKIPFLGIE